MFSIFHFFAALAEDRGELAKCKKLDQFPFDKSMLSCERSGRFPDLAVRVNGEYLQHPWLHGGELIEMKDAKSYLVPSFNSSIPSGAKAIADLTASGKLGDEMRKSGDDVHSLPERQVYYLLRGKRKAATKVCLVHGSFFETVAKDNLIAGAFNKVLGELGSKEKISAVPEQSVFASARTVDNASVSLRFRVMTEARPEANILKNYDDIGDDTVNLVVPLHGKSEKARAKKEQQIKDAAQTAGLLDTAERVFRIKHPFNGYFWVLQIALNARR